MSELKEISTKCMQGMLASKYLSDFLADGRGVEGVSCYDALALESIKYAEALIKQLDEKSTQ